MSVSILETAPGQLIPAVRDSGVFRSFLERSGVCVARTDDLLRIEQANADFRRLFAPGRPDVLGLGLNDLLRGEGCAPVLARLAELTGLVGSRFTDTLVSTPLRGTPVSGEMTALAVPSGLLVLVTPAGPDQDAPTAARRAQMLSELDARILEGVGAGVSTVQLAVALYLSRGGVEYHVKSLMRRFKVKNRPAMISKAYSTGIFQIGSWPPRVAPELVR